MLLPYTFFVFDRIVIPLHFLTIFPSHLPSKSQQSISLDSQKNLSQLPYPSSTSSRPDLSTMQPGYPPPSGPHGYPTPPSLSPQPQYRQAYQQSQYAPSQYESPQYYSQPPPPQQPTQPYGTSYGQYQQQSQYLPANSYSRPIGYAYVRFFLWSWLIFCNRSNWLTYFYRRVKTNSIHLSMAANTAMAHLPSKLTPRKLKHTSGSFKLQFKTSNCRIWYRSMTPG